MIKNTEQVAKGMVAISEADQVKNPFVGLTPEDIQKASKALEGFLNDPEPDLEQVINSFQEMSGLTVGFNILGNPRNYDYSRTKDSDSEDGRFSLKILQEEVNELGKALEENDRAELVDAVADVIVVSLGIALKFGVIEETAVAFAMISHNNLLKLKKGEDGNYYADRVNGKIQKPEGFVPHDVTTYIPYLKKGENNNA